jgi:predicted XRE-type DNA-binding protein
VETKKKSGSASTVINNCKNDARQHYVPGAKLTYVTRLKQMLKQELGYQGKPKILELLAEEIENITKECYVDKNDIGLGQIKVVVPSIHDKPGWSQTIEETVLITVTLTLHSQEDIEALKANKRSRLITQDKLMRIAKEAIEQGGVLSSAVAASLLNIKQTTVSKYVKEYFEREGKVVPLRGFVHDMGRTTTHKRWIIELYLNGYTTKQIQERTDHKIVSIDRYIKRYKTVENIIEELKTVDAARISRILDISEHSAREYTAIYLEYKETSKIKRLDFFKDIEELTEKTMNSVDKK